MPKTTQMAADTSVDTAENQRDNVANVNAKTPSAVLVIILVAKAGLPSRLKTEGSNAVAKEIWTIVITVSCHTILRTLTQTHTASINRLLF
jgi:hypothetical protein